MSASFLTTCLEEGCDVFYFFFLLLFAQFFHHIFHLLEGEEKRYVFLFHSIVHFFCFFFFFFFFFLHPLLLATSACFISDCLPVSASHSFFFTLFVFVTQPVRAAQYATRAATFDRYCSKLKPPFHLCSYLYSVCVC